MQTNPESQRRSPEDVMADHGIDLHYELTSGYAGRYIRKKARRISRRPGFSPSDVDDLSQQLTLKLLENLESFDPNKARFSAFVTTVVSRHATNIVRDHKAAKRDAGKTCSLSALVADCDSGDVTLSQVISGAERDRLLGIESISTEEAATLQIDVDEILASLPLELRTLAETLKCMSITEAAHELGVSRGTIYDKRKHLRKAFLEACIRRLR